jgi:hypothetical protein
VDLLSQAKEFIARKASKLAMVAVPLAVLAVTVPARASTVVLNPNGTDTCSSLQSGGTCIIVSAATGGNSGMNQVLLSGMAVASNPNGNFTADLLNSGGGTANSGLLAVGSVPVHWLFDITGNSNPVNWFVGFSLNLSDGTDSFTTSGTSSGGQVSGDAAISVLTAGNVLGYTIFLDTNSTTGYTLTVPANATLVINSGNSSAPEPASLWLMAGGGALLLLKKLKRRA